MHRLFTDAHDPLPASPDLLGVSFAWELDYANVLDMLQQLNIPLLADQRGDQHPLVRAQGAAFFVAALLLLGLRHDFVRRLPSHAIHTRLRPAGV